MMDTKTNDDAAFAAHMTASDALKSAFGRDPSAAEVACVLPKHMVMRWRWPVPVLVAPLWSLGSTL